jgi:uncharacterized membrane protein
MIQFLKIIHFMSLAVGIGGGAANFVIAFRGRTVEPAVRPILGGIGAAIGRMGAVAILLLWLSGIGLVYLAQDGWSNLSAAFWIKLAFVVLLTLISLTANTLVVRARRSGTPPPAPVMARLGQAAALSGLLIVIFAVIAFSG